MRDSRAARGSVPTASGNSTGSRRGAAWPAELGVAAHCRVAGEGDGLGAVGRAELEQDRRYVVLHRLDADAHSGCDRVVSQPAGSRSKISYSRSVRTGKDAHGGVPLAAITRAAMPRSKIAWPSFTATMARMMLSGSASLSR